MRLHQMESGPAKNALKRPFEGGSTVSPFYSLDIIAQVDHQNGMWMGYCDYWDHTGGMWHHWGGGMSCYIAIPNFGKFSNWLDNTAFEFDVLVHGSGQARSPIPIHHSPCQACESNP